MSAMWDTIVNEYEAIHDRIMDAGHPVARSYPLTDISVVLSLAAGYLLSVFVLYGIMKNVKNPLKLKGFSLCHNACMTILSLYMCLETLRQAYLNGHTLFSNGISTTPQGAELSRILWIFYVSKLPEFIDTWIMLLRGSLRQVTFLHVYHHSSVFVIQWATFFYAPGGESYLASILNSGVHVLMYGYYFWSACSAKPIPGQRLRWTQAGFYRPYITRCQLIQFMILFTQSVWDIFYIQPPKTYPIGIVWMLLFYMISMLALFGNFYIKAYSGKKSKITPDDKKETKKTE